MDSPFPRARRRPPAWLRALGNDNLPLDVCINGAGYHRAAEFKHDFFAATGLYDCDGERIVVKFGRRAPLFGLPMGWIGRLLTDHEARLYERLHDLPGIPAFLGRVGRNGFAHAFVEGRELRRGDRVNDDFFPRLAALLDTLHARGVAYVDLEKRENILVADDGRPGLIDFQISWHWPWRGAGLWPVRALLRLLQASDRYHLLKHWRRFRPDQLNGDQVRSAARVPVWIAGHRLLSRPFTLLRRRVLAWLGARPRAV